MVGITLFADSERRGILTTRVVMAVNNPATNDYRVVKSAEMLVRAGFECHVVGVLKSGFEVEEVVHGVTYHRVKVKLGLRALIAGFSPKIFLYINQVFHSQKPTTSKKTSIFNRIFGNREQILPSMKLGRYLLYFIGFFLLISFAKITWYVLVLIAFPFLFGGVVWRICNSIIVKYPKNRKIIKLQLLLREIHSKGYQRITKVMRQSYLRFFHLMKRFKRAILSSMFILSPERSSIAVKYLQGRYLVSFYDKLLALEGDIYHAHELWMLESCSIVATKLKRKLIYDSHELEVHRNNKWSIKSNQVRCDYEKRYIHNADAVFAVSNGCAKEIAQQYGLEEVLLLRNTPLLSKMTESKASIKMELNIGSESRLLIYTGSVTFNRGVELVLRALVHLTEYELVTVGPWNEQVKEELDELASNLDIKDRFHMYPKVPPGELISLISEGDISVIPILDACLSYRYCMPNKLFEAAFAGLPIVASDLPDMKEFIINNKLGVVFQNDNVASLVEAIRNIHQSNFYNKSQLNRERFIEEYCFEKESESLISKCHELIEGHEAFGAVA